MFLLDMRNCGQARLRSHSLKVAEAGLEPMPAYRVFSNCYADFTWEVPSE